MGSGVAGLHFHFRYLFEPKQKKKEGGGGGGGAAIWAFLDYTKKGEIWLPMGLKFLTMLKLLGYLFIYLVFLSS